MHHEIRRNVLVDMYVTSINNVLPIQTDHSLMVSRLSPSHPSPVTSRPTLCAQSLSVISGCGSRSSAISRPTLCSRLLSMNSRLSFISNQQAYALLLIALDEQPVPLSSSLSLEGLSLDSLSVASPPSWVLDALTVV